MKKEELIQKAYEIAVERYAAVGVDTEQVLKTMQDFHLSLHCWQADDVAGFEVQAGSLTGGIQATGNYPGKARNIDELRADILKAASYIPGTHRLNLHEIYGDFQRNQEDRSSIHGWRHHHHGNTHTGTAVGTFAQHLSDTDAHHHRMAGIPGRYGRLHQDLQARQGRTERKIQDSGTARHRTYRWLGAVGLT